MTLPQASRLAAAAVAVVLAALAVFWWRTRPAAEEPTRTETGVAAPVLSASEAAFYFPASSGWLELEVRELPLDLDPADRKRWLAEQLLAGPESEGLRKPLAEAEVSGVFAAPDGTVFLDLTIPESNGLGMGSTQELLAVYSVVNTLVLDDPSADRVVLLVNGRQRETLAGHLDTSGALRARPDLIREPG